MATKRHRVGRSVPRNRGKRRFVVVGADGSKRTVSETSADRALAAVVDGELFGTPPYCQGDDKSAAKTAEWARERGMKVL